MIKLGLLGEKLGHSLSPEIHNLIFEALNIRGEYRLYEVNPEELEGWLFQLKQGDLKGVNVTIPYKISVMEYLDEISPEAQKIGAVNTIVLNNGIMKGFNTDYFGIKASLERFGAQIQGSSAVILGTGGAAKAVFQCLRDLGAKKIKIVSRSPRAHEERWKNSCAELISYEELEGTGGDMIINCTPIGMQPNTQYSPVSEELLSNFQTAFDLIYNPGETRFLKCARERGLKTLGGLYMLVTQAAKAEELWNNIEIDVKIIENIYLKLQNKL